MSLLVRIMCILFLCAFLYTAITHDEFQYRFAAAIGLLVFAFAFACFESDEQKQYLENRRKK